MMGRAIVSLVRGALHFTGLLIMVTAAAAIIGCLFLPNGEIAYLYHPKELFDFIWNIRAGLKVNIVGVTLVLFFLTMEAAMPSRRRSVDGRRGAFR